MPRPMNPVLYSPDHNPNHRADQHRAKSKSIEVPAVIFNGLNEAGFPTWKPAVTRIRAIRKYF